LGLSALAGVLASFAASPAAHATGNRYTFETAATSSVDYRATLHAAVMPCPRLAAFAGQATTFRPALIAATADVPEHCRINGSLPTGIGFQINLPTRWNGRLYMFGNGGYAGEDAESPQEQASRDVALKNGFATARTDTGHLAAEAPLATFARDPDALINHGYRAVHETIAYAKALAGAFYGMAPRYAYWDGCSTGGREGVMSAQRYPSDFDGIVAAAPTLDWSTIMIKGLWNQSALRDSGLTFEKMDQVFKAVMADCDGLDGVKDGLIGDPRRCLFDPAKDLPACGSAEANTACFTPNQIAALRKLYAGPPKGPGTPAWVFQHPGFEHRSTLVPFTMMPDGSPNVLTVFAVSWMRYIGFKDPDYDSSGFDFNRDPTRIRGSDAVFNPTPDLAAFKARGGKMITFWGWSDTALNPQMGIDYYGKVVRRFGLRQTQDFYRLFLIPGMAHCSGGYGPDHIDAMTAVIAWVENGVAPERLAARRIDDGAATYSRAYCPYPAATKYKGSGDPEDPRSYACASPRTVKTAY